MKKILIAIDGSECSLRAVEHAGKQFSGGSGFQITLLHVLPYQPAPFWDDGHILTEGEKKERAKIVDKWLAMQRARAEPIFSKAVDVLIENGTNPQLIETKTISDSSDVAETILEETRRGGYQTLIVGRHGLTPVRKIFIGSISTKIINHGTGLAICIVE